MGRARSQGWRQAQKAKGPPKIYERHMQAHAIRFLDHVVATFPFRIREIRTDNGHEVQAKFQWHVEDQGTQLLSHKGDVDLEARLQEGERFFNLARIHGAYDGQTPYEALRAKL